MDNQVIITIIIAILVVIAVILGVLLSTWMRSQSKDQVRDLARGILASGNRPGASTTIGQKKQAGTFDADDVLKKTRDERKKVVGPSAILFEGGTQESVVEQSKLFQAGVFTAEDKLRFHRFQVSAPFVVTALSAIGVWIAGFPLLFAASTVILSVFIGLTLPKSYLERQIRKRTEETLYYLPLAIEQISIGVSSSLDLWPCIANILQMARERNTHNPVTELFIYVEKLIASGLSFQDALYEVGQACGIQQIRHTFQFLAQCAEHGGEVSKQLQELANAIMTERQTQIEGIIASLPVKATGPLFLVFAGYFALMMAGIFAKLASSLKMM